MPSRSRVIDARIVKLSVQIAVPPEWLESRSKRKGASRDAAIQASDDVAARIQNILVEALRDDPEMFLANDVGVKYDWPFASYESRPEL